jgi:hypothetical protein
VDVLEMDLRDLEGWMKAGEEVTAEAMNQFRADP